jgi:ankyrin repeat protein
MAAKKVENHLTAAAHTSVPIPIYLHAMKPLILIASLILTAQSLSAQTLADALKAKDTSLAATLIRKGANPNEQDAQGTTALMRACHFPDIPTAAFLLSHGVAPDKPRSPKGRTALMVACAYWCGLDMVKLLVSHGAGVNLAAEDGSTPLMLAAMNEKQDVVDYLLSKGAKADAKDAKGLTALDYAQKGKVEEYMITSIKDTRFSKEAVVASLQAAMKK